MYAYGRNSLEILKAILDESIQNSIEGDKGKVGIYNFDSSYMKWNKKTSKKKRSMKTIILNENLCEEFINDINDFRNSQEWYENRGIPYRRGYLLYGPPDTGKTSFLFALACELNFIPFILSMGGTNCK